MKQMLSKRVAMPVWSLALIAILFLGAVGAASSPDEEEDQAASVATTTTGLSVQASTASTTARPTTDAPTTTTAPTLPSTTTTAAAKKWVQVATASGTSDKRTPSFRLGSGESRLRYNSTAGILAVYVMDVGDSLEESGGFPEFTCTDPCEDETRLAKKAGEYYLEVKSANGGWSLVVEELK